MQHSLTVSIAEAIFLTGLSLAEVLIDFNLLSTHARHEVTDDGG